MQSLRLVLLTVMLAASALISGCATPGRTTNHDPLERVNRGIYGFNDALDRATIKPVAKGYQKITPAWMRTGVSNFFSNLGTPWVMVNELLQGKPKLMAQQTCRFVVNTTIGIGGLFDVASKMHLPPQDEDFGQTLAVWGVPSGPYIVLPFFGPSSLRDGFGRIPDYFARPTTYAEIPWETQTGLTALDVLQRREALLSVETTLKSAYDRYGVIRDVWAQQREYAIFDGNPPEEPLEDESLEPEVDDTPIDAPAQKPGQASGQNAPPQKDTSQEKGSDAGSAIGSGQPNQ